MSPGHDEGRLRPHGDAPHVVALTQPDSATVPPAPDVDVVATLQDLVIEFGERVNELLAENGSLRAELAWIETDRQAAVHDAARQAARNIDRQAAVAAARRRAGWGGPRGVDGRPSAPAGTAAEAAAWAALNGCAA